MSDPRVPGFSRELDFNAMRAQHEATVNPRVQGGDVLVFSRYIHGMTGPGAEYMNRDRPGDLARLRDAIAKIRDQGPGSVYEYRSATNGVHPDWNGAVQGREAILEHLSAIARAWESSPAALSPNGTPPAGASTEPTSQDPNARRLVTPVPNPGLELAPPGRNKP